MLNTLVIAFLHKTLDVFSAAGLAELNHVLTPRHKATQLSIECLRQVADAVYDVTVAYSGTQNPETLERTDAQGLLGKHAF